MELHQIRYFVVLAEVLNFTRAAEHCHISQPSLTRAIRKLEDELGGPLFRREGRQTHLTELGRMVRPRLEQALSLTESVRAEALDFSEMVNGTLTLGCMCTIAPSSVISLIEFFSQQAPQLSLNLREASGRKVADLLTAGEIDVALIALPAYPDALKAEPLFTESYVMTFPEGHRFEAMDCVRLADLDGERYLRRLNCEYLDVLELEGHLDPSDFEVRFESEHESWVQAMVTAGLGCAVMPETLADYPGLRSRPLVDPSISRTISVVTRRGRKHTPVVDFFVRLCGKIVWHQPSQ
ncbi:MAG: LysR family transcriptional regulator [Pseudomonadota bacterium]